jgi:TP53 regulating kinase-like protein
MENGSGGYTLALMKKIAKGAEADLFLDLDWNGKKVIIKKRGLKTYRHPLLDDEIRRFRTIHEADIIHRTKKVGVPTPIIYQVNPKTATIVMEYVEGRRIRDIIGNLDQNEKETIFKKIGNQAGRLHCSGIIHGDLTTSNMIKSGNRIVFIDFGLSEISNEVEKKGVDLNLMHRMLMSTHFRDKDFLLKSFIDGYTEVMGEQAMTALNRMREISMRGRYIEKHENMVWNEQ